MYKYGFKYRTILFVWLKINNDGTPQMGKGNYNNPCCEFLILGIKGMFYSEITAE